MGRIGEKNHKDQYKGPDVNQDKLEAKRESSERHEHAGVGKAEG